MLYHENTDAFIMAKRCKAMVFEILYININMSQRIINLSHKIKKIQETQTNFNFFLVILIEYKYC